jgi:uroporphyrinogen III methyltransferase/synthase
MQRLEGKRVLVTRAREDAELWAAVLRAAGAEAVLLPCIECETIDEPAVRAGLVAALADAGWLALTSRRGVEAVQALLPHGLPIGVAIAVVGPATARAAQAAFGRADLVSERGTAADLGAALTTWLAGEPAGPARRVVAAVAENAATTLEITLHAAGIDCRRIDVYRTLPAPAASVRTSIAALGVECILLASPSAVTGLLNRVELDRQVDVYSLGPATTAAARAKGLVVRAEAREPSLRGLLESMTCVR